jgi:hypothetical protein
MTDGINLTGFGETRPAGTNAINASGDWSPATGSFPAAADMSAQGMAGLNQEGSIEQMETGPDFSDSLMGGN